MTPRGNDREFATVTVAYAVTLLGLVLVPYIGQPRLWGLAWYGFLPRYSLAVLIAVGVAAYFYGRRLVTPARSVSGTPARSGAYELIAFFVVLGLTSAFVIFRTRTHFLGDGYQILAALESGGGVVKPWNFMVHLLQSRLLAVFGGESGGALTTFQAISIGSGIAALGIAALSARLLRDSLADRLIFFVGVATGGFVLLYFGYVENYPPFVTSTLAFLLFGLLSLKGVLGRFWTLLPLALAGLCHPYAVALLPAALYLLLHDTALGRYLGKLTPTVWMGISLAGFVALVAVVYFLSRASYFFRFSILPVLSDSFTVDGYTMLSLKHMGDLFSLLFTLVPSLLILVVLAGSSAFRSQLRSPSYRFLLVAGLFSLIIAFIFDPKLGMPRDWDLFSFVGLPLLLLLFFALSDRTSAIRRRRGAAVLAIALGVVVLAPRVALQADPERSIALFDSYAEMDPIRNVTGRFVLLQYLRERGREAEANRRMAENTARMRHEVLARQGEEALRQKKYADAVALLRQAIRLAPNWSHAWGNLGSCYLDLQKLDSAEICLKIADGLNPYNAQTYDNLAFLYLCRNDFEQGERYCRKALEIAPRDFNARGNLLKIYYKTGRTEEYRNLAYALAEEESTPADFVLIAAHERLRTENFPEAVRLYRMALQRGADTAYIREVERRFPRLEIIP